MTGTWDPILCLPFPHVSAISFSVHPLLPSLFVVQLPHLKRLDGVPVSLVVLPTSFSIAGPLSSSHTSRILLHPCPPLDDPLSKPRRTSPRTNAKLKRASPILCVNMVGNYCTVVERGEHTFSNPTSPPHRRFPSSTIAFPTHVHEEWIAVYALWLQPRRGIPRRRRPTVVLLFRKGMLRNFGTLVHLRILQLRTLTVYSPVERISRKPTKSCYNLQRICGPANIYSIIARDI